MFNDGPAFARPIHTTRHLKPPLSLVVKTVGQAIDLIIDDLSETEASMLHWQKARKALYDAYGAAGDESKLLAAEAAVREALRAEGSHVEPD